MTNPSASRIPDWFHGREMHFRTHFSQHEGTPALVACHGTNGTELDGFTVWRVQPDEWHIECRIHEYRPQYVSLSTNELRTAFKLAETPSQGKKISYGSEHVVPGKYIRSDRFLNIPGPGNEHWPENSISVYVDDDIQSSVDELIQMSE